MKNLKIELSLEDIQQLSKKQFCTMLKEAIQISAFEYLINKRGSKGQEIQYTELKMAEYLTPGYRNISIEEQRSIFSIRNRMIDLSANFPSGRNIELCVCGQELDMKHLYICKYWCDKVSPDIPTFEVMYTENLYEQIKVNKQFVKNYQKRKEYQTNAHLSGDPLSSFCTVMDNK